MARVLEELARMLGLPLFAMGLGAGLSVFGLQFPCLKTRVIMPTARVIGLLGDEFSVNSTCTLQIKIRC